jgi:hypothetical protein
VTYVERKLLTANSLGAVTLRMQYRQSHDPKRYAQVKGKPRAHGGAPGNYRVRFTLEH